jgi:hypothetical protein
MPLVRFLVFSLCCFVLSLLCSAQTVKLSADEARKIATVFVNRALEGKRYKSFSGKTHPYPKFEPYWWTKVAFADGRWRLVCDPPVGVTAAVSLDADGSNPKLEDYGYATQ